MDRATENCDAPAAVSLREVAARAGTNLGLIHRHIGSTRDLVAEVLEVGSTELMPAALAVQGFDFDVASQLLHHSSFAPRLIARIQVDRLDIRSVRRRFPVLRALLDLRGAVPTGPGPGGLTDPRVLVAATGAMALGSAIWIDDLRSGLGLASEKGIESAISDLARHLITSAADREVPAGTPSTARVSSSVATIEGPPHQR